MSTVAETCGNGRTLLDGAALGPAWDRDGAGPDPRLRVVGAALFALTVVALQHLSTLLPALAAAVLASAAVRLPLAGTVRRLLAMDGFMVLALASLPFTVPGAPLTVAGVALPPLSHAGVLQALTILAKANAVMLMALALVGALGPVRLGRTLARLGAPDTLVHLLLFTVRYLDVLNREYRRLRTAMRARGFRAGAGRHTWRSMGWLFGMLMVRSLERSERITAAMRCRGFTGRFPALAGGAPLTGRDWAVALAGLAAMGALVAADRLW